MPCLIHVTYPQFQFIVISVIELFCCNYRYLNIFTSDILFFLRNERREKSALKFTLIESLFLRLQREMLSNFLSLSDFFLIQYKTRKIPLNTIEIFDTPPPPHPCRRNSSGTGFVRYVFERFFVQTRPFPCSFETNIPRNVEFA